MLSAHLYAGVVVDYADVEVGRLVGLDSVDHTALYWGEIFGLGYK